MIIGIGIGVVKGAAIVESSLPPKSKGSSNILPLSIRLRFAITWVSESKILALPIVEIVGASVFTVMFGIWK